MHLHLAPFLSLLPLTTAIAPPQEPQPPQHIFSNPPPSSLPSTFRIPTSYESAILAHRILALTPLGTLSTIFPSTSSISALENRPQGLSGIPIGLMDYIATCESTTHPTILSLPIATSFKNAASGSNISLSLQWTPPHPPSSRISISSLLPFTSSKPSPKTSYSAANLPRFALLGYLEKIPLAEVEGKGIAECFVKTHPDSKYWLPGNRIHVSEFVRLVVQEVYWIGGFGDRAYIGWIKQEEWRSVTREEWENVRLPGERKGWKEWSFGSAAQWEL